jgi:hypothetical protein
MADFVTTLERLRVPPQPNALLRDSYQVHNIAGTGAHDCPCADWLTHWERGAGMLAMSCAVVGCPEAAQVGAHVRIEGIAAYWGILPFCRRHNATSGSLSIRGSVRPVAANGRLTCGE